MPLVPSKLAKPVDNFGLPRRKSLGPIYGYKSSNKAAAGSAAADRIQRFVGMARRHSFGRLAAFDYFHLDGRNIHSVQVPLSRCCDQGPFVIVS
jgi:hypothetical protein